MKLTTNGRSEYSNEEVNAYLRTFIKNPKGNNNLILNKHSDKPFKDQFTQLTQSVRSNLLLAFDLPETTSDKELIEKLDDLLITAERLNEANREGQSLKRQLAGIMVDEAIRAHVLGKDDREIYIKLATSSFDATKSIIYSNHQNRLELNELMKLSGHELYMTDKLERLKELNEDCFRLKLKESENYDYRNSNNAELKSSAISNENNTSPLSELDELMKLSAEQLYFEDGKMERLKVLNFNHFKLMYKEIFRVEYKA